MTKDKRGTTAKKRVFSVGDQVEVSGFYKPHDQYQLELKFEYQLLKERAESTFLVETYLFIPESLGVGDQLSRATDYFPSINSYMRYAVLKMSLEDLCDDQNKLSPMTRALGYLDTKMIYERKNQPEKIFIHEVKLIACLFKETAKSRFQECEEIFRNSLSSGDGYHHCLEKVQSFILAAKKFKALMETMLQKTDQCSFLSPEEKEGFAAIYEFIYYEYNHFLLQLLQKLEEFEKVSLEFVSVREGLVGVFTEFYQEGVARKFVVLNKESSVFDKERFIYRESKLKKYVSSILFLNRDAKSNKKAEEFLFGVAAGIAMLFATIVAVVTAYKYSMNSMQWVLSAVVAYIFKDRGKAWLQDKFRDFIPIYLAHRTEKLIDEGVGQVGALKEWLIFKTYKSLPKDILEVRMFGRETLGAFKKSEDILYHKKQIKLNNQMIFENHQRVDRLANIIRFNVQKFCQNMDDPVKGLNLLNEHSLVEKAFGKKVYHLNLVVKITSNLGEANEVNEKMNLRVILSRDGIERIESPYNLELSELFNTPWMSGKD